MLKFIFINIFLLVLPFSYGQETTVTDKKEKKNFVYIEPSSILGDLGLDLNNYWLVSGFQRGIGTRNFIDFKIGFIVKSSITPGDMLSPLNALYSRGMNLAFEHKLLLRKRLYYGTSIFSQYTSTIREENVYYDTNKITRSQYSVSRFVYGLAPKVGFLFVTPKHFYCDLSLGIGMRYIKSSPSGKKDLAQNLEREVFSNKIFDEGNKLALSIPIQLKLGYNF